MCVVAKCGTKVAVAQINEWPGLCQCCATMALFLALSASLFGNFVICPRAKGLVAQHHTAHCYSPAPASTIQLGQCREPAGYMHYKHMRPFTIPKKKKKQRDKRCPRGSHSTIGIRRAGACVGHSSGRQTSHKNVNCVTWSKTGRSPH